MFYKVPIATQTAPYIPHFWGTVNENLGRKFLRIGGLGGKCRTFDTLQMILFTYPLNSIVGEQATFQKTGFTLLSLLLSE